MRYEEFPIDPRLAPYVRLIWQLEIDRPADFGAPERVMPDGIVEIVFPYRAAFDLRFAGEPFRTQAGSFAISQTKRFVEIRPEQPAGFLSVRFYPWGAYHFFDLPVSAFADRAIGITELWGAEATEIDERLASAASTDHRVALVQRFLLHRLHRHAKRDVRPVVGAVWAGRGQRSVADLCRETGVTERTLERTFRSALGVSPKQFARLTRFLCACDQLKHGGWTTLGEVAHAVGYYDQSHFNAEFKGFAGVCPTGFLKHEHVAYLDVDS